MPPDQKPSRDCVASQAKREVHLTMDILDAEDVIKADITRVLF